MQDLLIQTAIVGVALAWFFVPFALFGVRRRLEAIAAAQRERTEAVAAELRRTHAIIAEEDSASVVTRLPRR